MYAIRSYYASPGAVAAVWATVTGAADSVGATAALVGAATGAVGKAAGAADTAALTWAALTGSATGAVLAAGRLAEAVGARDSVELSSIRMVSSRLLVLGVSAG